MLIRKMRRIFMFLCVGVRRKWPSCKYPVLWLILTVLLVIIIYKTLQEDLPGAHVQCGCEEVYSTEERVARYLPSLMAEVDKLTNRTVVEEIEQSHPSLAIKFLVEVEEQGLRCPSTPSLFSIRHSKDVWQEVKISGTIFLIYGAYWDDREVTGAVIRVLVMTNTPSPPTPHCLIHTYTHFPPTSTKATRLDYVHWQEEFPNEWLPYLVTCTVMMQGVPPTAVSLVESPCAIKPTNAMRIHSVPTNIQNTSPHIQNTDTYRNKNVDEKLKTENLNEREGNDGDDKMNEKQVNIEKLHQSVRKLESIDKKLVNIDEINRNNNVDEKLETEILNEGEGNDGEDKVNEKQLKVDKLHHSVRKFENIDSQKDKKLVNKGKTNKNNNVDEKLKTENLNEREGNDGDDKMNEKQVNIEKLHQSVRKLENIETHKDKKLVNKDETNRKNNVDEKLKRREENGDKMNEKQLKVEKLHQSVRKLENTDKHKDKKLVNVDETNKNNINNRKLNKIEIHEDRVEQDKGYGEGVKIAENSQDEDSSRIKKKDLALCHKFLFNPTRDFSIRLTEWIEAAMAWGVDHITFYIAAVHPNVTKVLSYYQSRGVVTLLPWSSPGNLPSISHLYRTLFDTQRYVLFTTENIPYTDCLLRHINTHRYVAVWDIDEFILPATNFASLTEMIDSAKTNAINHGLEPVSYLARCAYYFDDLSEPPSSNLPGYLHILRHVTRTAKYTPLAVFTKSIHDTQFALGLHAHFALVSLRGRIDKERDLYHLYPGSEGHLAHYRDKCQGEDQTECQEEYRPYLVRDFTMWVHRDRISTKTKEVLLHLGLIR